MPTILQPPTWTTQYGLEFNKQKWKPPHLKKRNGCSRPMKPTVPMATKIHIPHPPQPSTGDAYRMVDPDMTVLSIQGNGHTMHEKRPVDSSTGSRGPIKPTEAIPTASEPVDIKSKTAALHWICWPEKKKAPAVPYNYHSEKKQVAFRPHTSQGFHWDTPKGSATQQHQKRDAPVPVTYQPAYQSWTNATDDHEREALEAMYALRRSQSFYEPTHRPLTSISINDPPKDMYTGYPQGSVDPRTIYQQSFFPYHQAGGAGAREYAVMNQLSRGMGGAEPSYYKPAYNSYNKYPLHMRKGTRRMSASTDDYVHDRSMFMTTNPNCVGHFIIHPDWVSERSGLRRSNSMILNSSSKDGLRY